MMKGIREDLNQLVNNLKSGDRDTWCMTAIVGLSIYGYYLIFSTPC